MCIHFVITIINTHFEQNNIATEKQVLADQLERPWRSPEFAHSTVRFIKYVIINCAIIKSVRTRLGGALNFST